MRSDAQVRKGDNEFIAAAAAAAAELHMPYHLKHISLGHSQQRQRKTAPLLASDGQWQPSEFLRDKNVTITIFLRMNGAQTLRRQDGDRLREEGGRAEASRATA